jgi:sec-independent protein translocase protein TatB
VLDIGFSELVVIGVVALVVIGPERLPRVARTVGHLLGRFNRYVSEVKADINREIELSELKKIRSDVEEAARSVERTVKSEMHAAEEQFKSAEAELNKAGDGLRQMQAEVNESLATLSMPHMGMGQAQAPVVGGGASTPGLPEAAPAPSPALAAPEVEPSPQLELGLRADPAEPAVPTSAAEPGARKQG